MSAYFGLLTEFTLTTGKPVLKMSKARKRRQKICRSCQKNPGYQVGGEGMQNTNVPKHAMPSQEAKGRRRLQA